MLTVVSWNIEDARHWLDPQRFARQVDALGTPDVLCLQELRLRRQDTELVSALTTLLPGYACSVSLPDDAYNVKFRGGRAYGVATFVRTALAPATLPAPAWDREGRVAVVALPAHRLAVVNLYAVNGTAKPYYDPVSGEPSGDRHAFKRRFQASVFALAAELRTETSVILAGDWNVSRTAQDVTPRLRIEEPHATARAELAAHLERGWVDAFRQLHPDARQYTWFGRTRTGALDAARVDYIVVSDDLVPHVASAAILDAPALRRPSDHAPITLALRI